MGQFNYLEIVFKSYSKEKRYKFIWHILKIEIRKFIIRKIKENKTTITKPSRQNNLGLSRHESIRGIPIKENFQYDKKF